jgi:hypothetical protein
MSFGSGGTLNVGVLQAQFVLNASAAQGAIAQTITQTNTLKQAFSTTNILKIDNRQAVQAIQQTTGALDTFKKGLELIGAYKVFGLLEEGVKSLGDSIIGMNAKLQQSQTAFTALTGSAQTATTLVGQLETLASHSHVRPGAIAGCRPADDRLRRRHGQRAAAAAIRPECRRRLRWRHQRQVPTNLLCDLANCLPGCS